MIEGWPPLAPLPHQIRQGCDCLPCLLATAHLRSLCGHGSPCHLVAFERREPVAPLDGQRAIYYRDWSSRATARSWKRDTKWSTFLHILIPFWF